jgi:hypothetical protein
MEKDSLGQLPIVRSAARWQIKCGFAAMMPNMYDY